MKCVSFKVIKTTPSKLRALIPPVCVVDCVLMCRSLVGVGWGAKTFGLFNLWFIQ